MEIISSLASVEPTVAYITVFLLMIANGISNLPSSQILYLFVGYLATKGTLSLYMMALFGGLGNAVGNIILYEIVKSKGASVVKKSLSKVFKVDDVRQDHFKNLLEKHGVIYIFLGKLIPGVKTFIPIVAGLTTIKRSLVYSTLIISSIIWAVIFLHIGALFGANTEITKWYGIAATIILIALYIYTLKKHPHLFKSTDLNAK